MTDESTVGGRMQWLPRLQSRWWTVLLGASLMVNLLVIGLAIGLRFDGGPVDRVMGASYIQLIPRSFLRDLPRERRKELMGVVRERSHTLRELRATSHASPLQLADTLENPAATEADIKSAIDLFTTGTESLAAGGGAVVMEIVARLTPEERKLLAAAIRERAEKSMGRKRN